MLEITKCVYVDVCVQFLFLKQMNININELKMLIKKNYNKIFIMMYENMKDKKLIIFYQNICVELHRREQHI